MTFGIEMRVTWIRISFLVAALLLTPAAQAETANANVSWDLPQLMQSLAQVKSAKNKFTERKYLSLLDQPLLTSGKLVYTAPAHLEKLTLTPKPETMVLDGDRLSLDIKGKRRTLSLQNYPLLWAFVESIRGTLAGDLPVLKRFYRVDLEGDAAQWQLLLMPTDPEVREVVREIRIGGKRNRVLSVEVLEVQGDRSVMTITEDGA